MKQPLWLLPVVLLVTVLAYLPGLSGPFLFDDTPHVSGNTQVHITDLSLPSLRRAWNSSLATGIGSRPLAQLTFGINHALAGLDTFWFKATNLAVHLVTGLLVFALTWQLTQVLTDDKRHTHGDRNPAWPALLAAALWLLHPINVTPVLYVVQRMTELSALFLIAGLWCHVRGRRLMAMGDGRGLWLALAGLPIAGIGVLAKESAALYPLLVLVLEWTLLRHLAAPRRGLLVALVGWLPITLGLIYLTTHLDLINYQGRPFTLEERLLSEARVMWLYVRLLILPDPAALGFYHDDIVISHSWLQPWTTLPAVLVWLALGTAALIGARRWPVPSCAVLFFVAGHAMEASVFPLELVFEHRNYVPVVGPLFALAWLLTRTELAQRRRAFAATISLTLLVLLAAVTHLRALAWQDQQTLILTEVSHHPDSPRANFRAAQLLMDQIGRPGTTANVAEAAGYYLARVLALDPDNLNARFGEVLLPLFTGKQPSPMVLNRLKQGLRGGLVGPTKLSVGQFTFLVRWQLSGTLQLPHQEALAILQAALDNPRMTGRGRAAVLSALRAYHERVLHDPLSALPYARAAVRAWPADWQYHYRLVELLIRLDRWSDAHQAYQAAIQLPSAELHPEQRNELTTRLRRHVMSQGDSTHD